MRQSGQESGAKRYRRPITLWLSGVVILIQSGCCCQSSNGNWSAPKDSQLWCAFDDYSMSVIVDHLGMHFVQVNYNGKIYMLIMNYNNVH